VKKKSMDLAIYWLPVVGTILIGIAACIWWGNGNKTTAVWVGIFRMCHAVTAFGLTATAVDLEG